MLACFALALLAQPHAGGLSSVPNAEPLVVGSKNFTESHVLGEILTQYLRAHTTFDVRHESGLGGTLVCFQALESGAIDIYPDYTGTLLATVVEREQREQGVSDPLRVYWSVADGLRREHDVELLAPFGFDNTYAIAMREQEAEARGLRRLSDLAGASSLRGGFSLEFVHRADGWAGLAPAYGIELADVRPMEHALAYDALLAGETELIDAYSTDAKLLRYGLRVLEDDRGFFPPYDALPLAHGATLREHPELRDLLARLAFCIDAPTMTSLNHRVEENGEAFADVARSFLTGAGLLDVASDGSPSTEGGADARPDTLPAFLWSQRREILGFTLEHLALTATAVVLAVLFAVPLGIWLARRRLARRFALGLAGVLQTVPSLALLAFLIAVPGFGLTARSAVAALFLYALLPLLHNTTTGIAEVDADVVDAAHGMGLTPRQVLLQVELPLALPTLFAGLRTATVISIGVATLAAFIGAGGLGEPIVTGLYLNDPWRILSGAIPAALLALLVDALLGRLAKQLASPSRG